MDAYLPASECIQVGGFISTTNQVMEFRLAHGRPKYTEHRPVPRTPPRALPSRLPLRRIREESAKETRLAGLERSEFDT